MGGRNWWLVLSCLLALSLVLASCGPAVEEEEEVPVVEEEEEVPVVEEEEEVPIVEEEEEVPVGTQYGGTLYYGSVESAADPPGWDFAKWQYNQQAYSSYFYEPIVVGDWSKGPSGTGEYQFLNAYRWTPDEYTIGCIAESWDLLDPLTLVFHIRQGVRWQNKAPVYGRELTATDVAFCYNRQVEARWPRHSFIESIEATDKYTVVVKFNQATGRWIDEIGDGPYFLVYPPEVVEAGMEDWKNACGTGPFMLTDYVSGANLIYEKNPDYWDTWTKDGKEYQLPFLDKIIIPIIPDESTRLAALQSGKIDVWQGMSIRSAQILEGTTPELEEVTGSTTSFIPLHFRVDQAPFSDINVRRALSMAVDRYAIRDAIYQGMGDIYHFPFVEQDAPKAFFPLEELPEETRLCYEYDPEKAKELLTAAGYPDGFNTSVDINAASSIDRDLAEMIVNYWDAIGVTCEIIPDEVAILFSKAYAREYDLIMIGTQSNEHSIGNITGGSERLWNFSNLDDDFVNTQWEIACSTYDVSERNKILKGLMERIQNQVPALFLPAYYTRTAWWPWVKNYGGIGSLGYGIHKEVAYIWIDQDVKKSMGH